MIMWLSVVLIIPSVHSLSISPSIYMHPSIHLSMHISPSIHAYQSIYPCISIIHSSYHRNLTPFPFVFLSVDNVEFPVELNDVIVQESDLDDKCLGCREGFIVYWLITHNGWTHLQLTPDGLKSIVFVDPSPTWCIANGKVWFDLPNHKKTGCLFREAIKGMNKRDDPKLPSFDWVQLRVTSHVCLRLTEAGLADQDTVIPV